MSNMKKLLDNILADWEDQVYTIEQMAEKYDMTVKEMTDIIVNYYEEKD